MRRSRFFVFSLAFLGLVYFYLASRLLGDSHDARFALAVPFVLVWMMPAIFWSLETEPPAWVMIPLQWLSFFSMAWLSFTWVFTLARDALVWPAIALGAAVLRPAFSSTGNLAIMGLAVVAVLYGALRALGPPRLREIDVPIAGLPEELAGFRIAQLTDLHVGATIGRKFVAEVARRVGEAKVDMLALTGDFGDGEPESLRAGLAPLGNIKTAHGTFYVLGNHECYWNAEGWTKLMASLGANVLLNEGREIVHRGARIHVGGVVDPTVASMWRKDLVPDPVAAAQGGEGAAFRILLAHQPGIFPEAEKAGFDLQLSGHTHGGQFFPWTLLVRKVHPIAIGLERHGRLWVYVSPGTGSWGPPVRIGTSTEITLLKLVRA